MNVTGLVMEEKFQAGDTNGEGRPFQLLRKKGESMQRQVKPREGAWTHPNAHRETEQDKRLSMAAFTPANTCS